LALTFLLSPSFRNIQLTFYTANYVESHIAVRPIGTLNIGRQLLTFLPQCFLCDAKCLGSCPEKSHSACERKEAAYEASLNRPPKPILPATVEFESLHKSPSRITTRASHRRCRKW